MGLNEPRSIVHLFNNAIFRYIIYNKVIRQVSALSGLAFHDFCSFLLVLLYYNPHMACFIGYQSPLFTCKFRQCQRGLLLSPWHLSPRRFVTRHICIVVYVICGDFIRRSFMLNTRSMSIKLGCDGVGLGQLEIIICFFPDISSTK